MNNAYQEGRDARDAGKKQNANPHHMSSAAHELWHEGWEDRNREIICDGVDE